MRYTLAVAGLAAGLGLGVGLLVGRHTADKPRPTEAPEKQAPAPPGNPAPVLPPKKDEPPAGVGSLKPIPLSSVCGTSGQVGLKDSLQWRIEGYQERWEPLLTQLKRSGTQTAFLVNAATVYAAADDAADLLGGRGNADRVELAEQAGTEELWAFVYLGTWSNCPFWEINSVLSAEYELVVNYKLLGPARGML